MEISNNLRAELNRVMVESIAVPRLVAHQGHCEHGTCSNLLGPTIIDVAGVQGVMHQQDHALTDMRPLQGLDPAHGIHCHVQADQSSTGLLSTDHTIEAAGSYGIPHVASQAPPTPPGWLQLLLATPSKCNSSRNN